MSAEDRRNADWMLSADRKTRPDRGKRGSKDNGRPKPRPNSRKVRRKSLENRKLQYVKRRSADGGTPIAADHGTPCLTHHGHDDREINPTLVQMDLSSKSPEEFVEKMLRTTEGGGGIGGNKRSTTEAAAHGSFQLLFNCSITHVKFFKSRCGRLKFTLC